MTLTFIDPHDFDNDGVDENATVTVILTRR